MWLKEDWACSSAFNVLKLSFPYLPKLKKYFSYPINEWFFLLQEAHTILLGSYGTTDNTCGEQNLWINYALTCDGSTPIHFLGKTIICTKVGNSVIIYDAIYYLRATSYNCDECKFGIASTYGIKDPNYDSFFCDYGKENHFK